MSPPTDTPPLVGRDAELTAIDRAVARLRGGGSPVIVLIGEPGIGKSALLGELHARSAATGAEVLLGRASEHERDVPFGPLVDALDDRAGALLQPRLDTLGPERLADLGAILPSLSSGAAGAAGTGDAGASAAERFRYHRALRALLELLARQQPLALLLDDLHWADEATVELVLHLLRRQPHAPVLLAVALRPSGPVERVLDALRTVPGAQPLLLGPLAGDAARTLLSGVTDARTRTRIERDAGGNPLYLLELARSATAHAGASGTGGIGTSGGWRGAAGSNETSDSGTLPPTLAAVVQSELGGLDADARTLVAGAAVAGDPFDPELAAGAAGLDPERALPALDTLLAAGLVLATDGPRRFAFRHPVVRRAIYDAAPSGWRLAAHERAAAALTARGAAAPARAFHVEQCAHVGDAAAAQLLTEAAEVSRDRAPATAARWYGAALAIVPEADAARRLALLVPMATALADAGRIADARDALTVALALSDKGSDGSARVALIARLAELEHLLGDYDGAVARLQRALAELGADAPAAARATLELELASAAIFPGRGEEMARWSARALASSADGGEPALTAWAEAVHAIGLLLTGRVPAAYAAVERAEQALAQADDAALGARLDAVYGIGGALFTLERYADARSALQRGLAIVRETRQDRLFAQVTGLLGMLMQQQGEPLEAAPMLSASIDAARLQGLDFVRSFALAAHVLTLDAQGEAAEARRAATEIRELAARLGEAPLVRTALANVATLQLESDPERCLHDLREAGGEQLERVDQTWVTWLTVQAVRAEIACGQLDAAEQRTQRLEQFAAVVGLRTHVVRAQTARAELLLARDDATAAAALAGAAADDAEEFGNGWDGLAAALLSGRALGAAGARDDAIARLRAMAESAERRGAVRSRDAAARELRRLGARARTARIGAAGATQLAALTAREREVAELVAQGQANKQVAATLFISEKTVEYNLSRVYAKLGIRSRVELAALVAGTG